MSFGEGARSDAKHPLYSTQLQGSGGNVPQLISRQSESIAHAFTASEVVRLLNRIEGEHQISHRKDANVVSNGIELADVLVQGYTQAENTKSHLMWLESADLAVYMREHGAGDIHTLTNRILPFLKKLLSILKGRDDDALRCLDPEELDATRDLFRQIQVSIGEQLGISQPPE